MDNNRIIGLDISRVTNIVTGRVTSTVTGADTGIVTGAEISVAGPTVGKVQRELGDAKVDLQCDACSGALDRAGSEGLGGMPLIVGETPKSQIRGYMRSAQRERMDMIQLQKAAGGASTSGLGIRVGATTLIPTPNLVPNRRGDITVRSARAVGLRRR